PLPTDALVIIGGKSINECDGLPSAEEYISFVRINASPWNNTTYNFTEDVTGRHFSTRRFKLDQITDVEAYISQHGFDSKGAYIAVKLLPGTKQYVTHYRIYARPDNG